MPAAAQQPHESTATMPPCDRGGARAEAHPQAAARERNTENGQGVLRRALEVVRVIWTRLFVPWLLRRRSPNRAERMQAALEDLGGTWIKLGQALALRFDILPADYCVQFFQLLNQVRPFPAAAVRRTLEHELGRPMETLFRSFDWQPLAAASIGQVHRAELPDGTAVAVKIQRPGIRAQVRADLRLMRWMAAAVDTVLLFRRPSARDLVREFARWTEEELDYRLEARHVSVLRENAAGDPMEHNPHVYAAYTTARVLTLEYLPGIPVIDIIAALRRGDGARLGDLAARGHDTRRIASHIVWNALNQIYRFGYFHADPHPANLIVMPDDAIGYVDFGIVGKLDDRTTESLRYFAQSLFAGHVGAAVDEFMRFLTPARRTDLGSARRDLVETLKGYLESQRVDPAGLTTSGDIFEIEMLALVRQHGMALAPDVVRYLKAVLTAEAMVKELDPDFDLRAHENRFFGRLMQIELRERLSLGHAAQWFLDTRVRIDRLFGAIDSVRETPGQFAGVARRVRRRVQLLSGLTIAGWLTVLTALWESPARTGIWGFGHSLGWIGFAIGAVSVVLLVSTILQVRRLPGAPASAHVDGYPHRLR